MAHQPLHLRRMSPDRPFDENMRIADAVMDYVEQQARVRGHNTPEELEMLLEVQRCVREFGQNIKANAQIVRSAMLDESEA